MPSGDSGSAPAQQAGHFKGHLCLIVSGVCKSVWRIHFPQNAGTKKRRTDEKRFYNLTENHFSLSPFDARSKKKKKNVHLDCGIKSFEWDVQSFRCDLSNVESLLRNSHANYDNISNKCPTGLSDEGLTFYVQKVKFAVTSQ